MKFATTLLNIAQDDLKSSIILYEKGLYPQALFYFQQAVEKSNKAFALFNEIITPEELQNKIGHNTLNIYNIILKAQQQLIIDISAATNINPQLRNVQTINNVLSPETKRVIDKGLESLYNIKTNKKYIVNMTDRDIINIIQYLTPQSFTRLKPTNKIVNTIKTSIACSKKENIELLLAIGSEEAKREATIISETSLNTISDKRYKSIAKAFCKTMNKVPYLCHSLLVLYFTSIITLPHSINTRYPDIKKSTNPKLLYTKSYPLIKYLPYFYVLLKKTFRCLPEYAQ
ncbi:MAG: HEPN domain-containing protein [Bacteroidota bacterium]